MITEVATIPLVLIAVPRSSRLEPMVNEAILNTTEGYVRIHRQFCRAYLTPGPSGLAAVTPVAGSEITNADILSDFKPNESYVEPTLIGISSHETLA